LQRAWSTPATDRHPAMAYLNILLLSAHAGKYQTFALYERGKCARDAPPMRRVSCQ